MNISANNLYKNTLIIIIAIIVNNFFMFFFIWLDLFYFHGAKIGRFFDMRK